MYLTRFLQESAMNRRPIILFSTITGNAYKLACAAAAAMPCEYIGPYNLYYYNRVKPEIAELYETFILTYWCNRGTADDETIDFIGKLKGKNLVVLGSLGVDAESAHAQKVRENVESLVKRDNNLLAHYLCQGSIDLKRTFEKTKIPEGEAGHLSMERFERQKLSLGHPDEDELKAAGEIVKEAIKGLL